MFDPMSGPSGYKEARRLLGSSDSPSLTVDNSPYLPNIRADLFPDDAAATASSVASVAVSVLTSPGGALEGKQVDPSSCSVSRVSGGITNALFRIDIPSQPCGWNAAPPHPFLLRVFGAEGMIDRDDETSTYSAVCSFLARRREESCEDTEGLSYHGRFSNGRVEGWLDGYRALTAPELGVPVVSAAIARSLAGFHAMGVPDGLEEVHDSSSPGGCWDQLETWLRQARSAVFRTPVDEERAAALNIDEVAEGLQKIKEGGSVPTSTEGCALCHNDLLSMNIMMKEGSCDAGGSPSIRLIDFEYGGWNYVGFDIANHFNEWAGGTDDGRPDYDLFPNDKQREIFCAAYLDEKRRIDSISAENKCEENDNALQSLLSEVDCFILVNHLYWGLWAVNQASAEGCDDFDYLLYAANRIGQYRALRGY
mmetsp:Transcript_41411/g.81150  ORF Transcript_41411/g.81150 Transcript_41411/m.81150 type:complete len:423 (+) Transcript_41411:59-1327(+)